MWGFAVVLRGIVSGNTNSAGSLRWLLQYRTLENLRMYFALD
jgi:hypothetical protein